MNKSTFTPGPWVAIFPDSRIHHEGVDITSFDVMTEKTRAQFRAEGREHYDRRHEDVANVSIVGSQFWRDMTDEEAKANARLIAAAPELLEALQKFVAWSKAENDHKNTTFWDRFEMLRDLDVSAAAAIAKATGEAA